MSLRRLLLLPALVVAAIFAGGCSHYRLGTTGTLDFTTVYVAPVRVETLLPQATVEVTTALRERFAADGRVRLVADESAADVTVLVRLTHYGREVATVLPNDTGLARKFDLLLDGTVTLRDNRRGTLLLDARPVQARRQAFTDDGQLQAEYQTLPLLAEQLADRAAHAVLDVW